MPRLPRPDFQHTYHHVVVRGVDGLPIFDSDEKKEQYINIMKDVKTTHDISIYTIGFMDEHVHQFVRRNNQSMGIFYRRVNGRYGSWYNKRFNRTGALYDERYYSSLVDSENYFQAVWRYSQHQEVKSGKYQSAADDPWSSARVYLNLNSRYHWIDWQEALNELDVGQGHSAKRLLKKQGIEQSWPSKEAFPHELYRGQRFLADKTFIEKYMQIRKRAVRKKLRKKTPIPWDDLLKIAVKLSGLSEKTILTPGRSKKKVQHRAALAYACRKYGHLPIKDIAEKLSVSPSGVSRMIKRFKEKNHKLRAAWAREFEAS